MKHHIIVKFKKEVNVNEILPDIKNIFNETLNIDGIYSVVYKTNCIDRENRFNLMIILDMDENALNVYDKSNPHLLWKEKYSSLIEAKAIFDSKEQ